LDARPAQPTPWASMPALSSAASCASLAGAISHPNDGA
jgi:hypothetical protein